MSVFDNVVIGDLVGKMPEDVGCFEVNGQLLFPIYSNDGGISSQMGVWVIKKGEGDPTRLNNGGNLPRVKTTDPDGWTYLPLYFSTFRPDPDAKNIAAEILKAAQELQPVPTQERLPVRPKILKMAAEAKIRIRRIETCANGHRWLVEHAPGGQVSNHVSVEACFCGYVFTYRGALIGAIAE